MRNVNAISARLMIDLVVERDGEMESIRTNERLLFIVICVCCYEKRGQWQKMREKKPTNIGDNNGDMKAVWERVGIVWQVDMDEYYWSFCEGQQWITCAIISLSFACLLVRLFGRSVVWSFCCVLCWVTIQLILTMFTSRAYSTLLHVLGDIA